MEKTKIKLSFENKKEMLKDLFGSLVNPDTGLSLRKCVMQNWYEIRPGLRNGTETLFFAFREHDGALCVFESLPHGTQDDDHFHTFDKYPSLEIIPKENNPGFRIKMEKRDDHSQGILNEIGFFEEVILVYKDFSEKYKNLIESKSL